MWWSYLRIEDWMLVASDEATAGSVMAKHDLISPFRSGRSQACTHQQCCSGVLDPAGQLGLHEMQQ